MVIVSNNQSKRPKRPDCNTKKYLRPGKYDSVVLDVREPEGFAHGNAVDIFYRLTSPSGDTFEKEERFFNSAWPTEREQNFFDYLDALGIDIYDDWANLNDFIGCHECLTLAKEVKGPERKVYLNIVNREFVSAPANMDGECDETE